MLGRPDFPDAARAVLARGGPGVALHLRGPHTAGRALFALAGELVPAARAAGALLLVNDRVDVALAAGADGVQLGRRSMLPADARRLLGPDAPIGASVGDAAGARDAAASGAGFLVAGSVYPTASHPGREGIGPGALAELAAAGVPVVAVGGIVPARVAELRAAGAHGVAAIRAVWDAADPAEAVATFLEALDDADD